LNKKRKNQLFIFFIQVKVLVLANKQDLPQAMTVAEVSEKLQLKEIKDKPWYIQSCSAVSGDGLSEGLDWLADAVKKKQNKRNLFFNTKKQSKTLNSKKK
jgi:signal recognition particle receptor subunit beta